MALCDLENHRKSCEANPDFRKSCLKECGAMIRKQDTANHNCVDYLKFTIGDLKRMLGGTLSNTLKEIYLYKLSIKELKLKHILALEELRKESELNLKKTRNNLNKEIDVLNSTIRELKLAQSNGEVTVASEPASNPRAISEGKMIFTNEKDKYKVKLRRLMSDNVVGNYFNYFPAYRLKAEIIEAKKKMQVLKEFLGDREYKWVHEISVEYEKLEKALMPMDPKMREDVINKYGEALPNFTGGMLYWFYGLYNLMH